MRSFILFLIALFALGGAAFAQDAAEYQKSFQAGIDALNSGRLDEGIAAFKKCIEINPQDPVCAYNVACGYAKKGEKDTAFTWLDQAAGWGFGNLNDSQGRSNVEFAPTDTDLTPLHEDPRWAKFIEKLTAGRKALDDFRSNAAVYVPKALEGAAEMPLLVVLHDVGKTKNDVIEGRWKKLADELGCALVAPSGKNPLKPLDPAAGMSWYTSQQAYKDKYRDDERPVSDAYEAFRKTHKLAADRVYIAGEGQGATLAFNIAVAKPYIYKGVLLVDGAFNPSMAAPRVPSAVKSGLRVHALLDKAALAKLVKGGDAQALVDNMEKSLADWGLVHQIDSYEVKEGEPDPVPAKALAALKGFAVPAAAPVEAGSGK